MPEPHNLRAEIFLPTPANVPALLPESWPLIIRFKSAIFSHSHQSFFTTSRPGLVLQAARKHPFACELSLFTTSHLLSPPPFFKEGAFVCFLDNVYPQTLGIFNQLIITQLNPPLFHHYLLQLLRWWHYRKYKSSCVSSRIVEVSGLQLEI